MLLHGGWGEEFEDSVMEKKKICIFMHGFAGGGAERMTVALANRLVQQGHSVTFLVRYGSGNARTLLAAGIPVVDMGIGQKGKIRKNLVNIKYLRRFMKNWRFDAILCITIEMSQVAAAASYLMPWVHVPLISVIHNTVSVERHSFDFIRKRLYPYFDRRMSAVIAVSKAVASDYRKVSLARDKKVFTVYNPVISEEIFSMCEEPADHPWLVPERKFRTLVLSGRLTFQKNHELIFSALQILRQERDYRLILLGEGEREKELKAMVCSMKLEGAVDFRGYVKNPFTYYRACDAMILSSKYEGLPTVLIEGLACGCRIVSTDCPSGPREILKDGKYGILVPMEDPEALAAGILKSLQTAPDRDILRQRAMEFDVASSVRGYLAVIDYVS